MLPADQFCSLLCWIKISLCLVAMPAVPRDRQRQRVVAFSQQAVAEP